MTGVALVSDCRGYFKILYLCYCAFAVAGSIAEASAATSIGIGVQLRLVVALYACAAMASPVHLQRLRLLHQLAINKKCCSCATIGTLIALVVVVTARGCRYLLARCGYLCLRMLLRIEGDFDRMLLPLVVALRWRWLLRIRLLCWCAVAEQLGNWQPLVLQLR